MKRFLLFAVAVLAFVGCNEMFEDEGNSRLALSELPTLTAGFEDADTRTYVENNKFLRWHEGDLISAFVGDTKNVKYIFDGKTGDASGEFKPANDANAGTGNIFDKIYAVYPYEVSTAISNDGVIRHNLPTFQTYANNSFGKGANPMVAVAESMDDTSLIFKNVCGYLKIKLYGEGTVKSIELRGNNGEKIAGNVNITATYGGVPKIAMADDATESITLDCGQGVELSADADNPTEFWVVLPPMEFSKGITIVATDINKGTFEQSTSKKVVVERNIIQPMTTIKVEFEVYDPTKPAKNEIWYTSSDGNMVELDNGINNIGAGALTTFGANIVSHTYENGKGVIKFDGDVTTIGYYAFYGCDSLTSVTIGDSVTTIGYIAFQNCRSLKEFKGKFAADNGRCLIMENTLIAYAEASGPEYAIPDNVTTIGSSAFAFCDSLTSITIPNSVTTIGSSAFAYCYSLTSVTIGDNVTTIGNSAFAYCDSLTSVTIGDSVTTIGSRAFAYCDSLTSVTIGDSVTTIGYIVFLNCRSLKEFKGKFAADNGRCLIIDGTLNSFAPAGLTEYTIPDSVTTIGEYAFSDCDSLTSITIPDSVTTIGYYAFSDCDSLTSITIPDSVTTIGYEAFSDCNSLTSVYCKATTPPSLGKDAFKYYSSGEFFDIGCTIYVPTDSVDAYKSASGWDEYADDIVAYDFDKGDVAPDTPMNNEIWYTSADGNIVTPYTSNVFGATIVSNTYEDGKGVITFDGAVTTIGDYAFYWCESLTSVTIPDSVTTIGRGAFADCDTLKEFKGKYATDNGRCLIVDNTLIAYAYASGTEYTIPDSVTTIGGSAFYYCKSLTSVTIPDSVTTIGDSAFSDCKSLTSVTIGDSVTTIGEWAFYHCGSLRSVTIGDSVTTIGDYAFGGCRSLTSITIPNSVTTIGERAFYSCDSLTSVTIGDSVTTIGEYAFAHCDSLTSVTIGDSVTTIEKGAFARCGFTSITIPDSVTTIGERAFENCDSLTSVTIPDSVTTIEGMAFYDCSSLTSVTIPDSVTTIGDSAFCDCSSLTSITIPNSVTTIGDHTFDSCDSLTSVTIPDSVTTIGYYAFYDCDSLTSVTIPDSVTTIGNYAFIWCGSLTSVTIGDSVTTIGREAFSWCSSLTSVYCKATTPPTMGVGVFESTPLEAIYVPTASADAYKAAKGWRDYADDIVGYDF